MRVMTFLAVLGLVAGISAGGSAAWAADTVPADDAASKVKAYAAQIDEHKKADDKAALVADAGTGVALYREVLADEVQAKAVIKELGSLSKDRDDDVKVAALTALGETQSEHAARYVKSYLRVVDEELIQPETTAAIQAAAKIADDGLVEPLLKMVDDSKNFEAAAQAMRALGGFGKVKRKREKILEELVDSVQRSKPGGRPGNRGSNEVNPDASHSPGKEGDPSSRWPKLAPALVESLNQLTGQKMTSPEDWFDVAKENKGKLGRLFKDD
jgi:hypothetical protein